MTVTALDPPAPRTGYERLLAAAEQIVIPLGALVVSALIFSLFLLVLAKSPAEFFALFWKGGFGSSFSIQNTLQRSAPLILTALVCAIPAQIGLLMIGAEGTLVLGDFAAAAIAILLVDAGVPPLLTVPLMILAATSVGAL